MDLLKLVKFLVLVCIQQKSNSDQVAKQTQFKKNEILLPKQIKASNVKKSDAKGHCPKHKNSQEQTCSKTTAMPLYPQSYILFYYILESGIIIMLI